MRIVIRSDAGAVAEIGTGHIIRALKLSEALLSSPTLQGCDVLFATRGHEPYELGRRLVKQAGFNLIDSINLEPNSRTELQSILDTHPNIVIFDRLATDDFVVTELKKADIFVVTFDDLGSGRRSADLSIHPLLQNVEKARNIYVGYEYLFSLTEELPIHDIAPIALQIFVSFGGFDHRGLLPYFLNLIQSIEGPIRYVLIASNLNISELTKLRNHANNIGTQRGLDIVVHQRPSDFYKLLRSSDLAIVSGGLTAFACAQLGVPAIGIPQYEHQIENIERLERLGCLVYGSKDMELNAEYIPSLVSSISSNQPKRAAMSMAGKRVIDGCGLHRTVQLIEQYLGERFHTGYVPSIQTGR